MAYIYLLDIYKLIDQRIEDAKSAMGGISADPNEIKYQEGRVTALTDFKEYLIQTLNPKLPRRVRENFELKN